MPQYDPNRFERLRRGITFAAHHLLQTSLHGGRHIERATSSRRASSITEQSKLLYYREMYGAADTYTCEKYDCYSKHTFFIKKEKYSIINLSSHSSS